MERRPHQLPRDVLEAELEVRVLIDRVVAGVEGERADRVALAVGDLARRDDPRRIARARRGDGAVERLRRGVAQRDDGRRRLEAGDFAQSFAQYLVYSSRNASVSKDFMRSKNRTPLR